MPTSPRCARLTRGTRTFRRLFIESSDLPLDHALFERHMDDASLLSMVLKGHLWVESCLNRALTIAFERPDSVEIGRLPFSSKVNLCLAAGAIDQDVAPAMRLLNKIRNRIAHDLHSEVSLSDILALEQSFSGRVASTFARVKHEGSLRRRLYIWLYTALMHLEYGNMVREYNKTNQTALMVYELAKLLDASLAASSDKAATREQELMDQHGVPPRPDANDVWENFMGGGEIPS